MLSAPKAFCYLKQHLSQCLYGRKLRPQSFLKACNNKSKDLLVSLWRQDSTLGHPQSHSANNHPQNWRYSHSSRKEARKQGRTVQKQKKAEYFARAQNLKKRAAEKEHVDSPQHKKVRQTNPVKKVEDLPVVSVPVSTQKPVPCSSNPVGKTLPSKPPKQSALEKLVKKAPTPKTPAEDKEDRYIALLESKLGIKKGSKRKAKSAEEDDGLDGMSPNLSQFLYCCLLFLIDLMDWADSFLPSYSEVRSKYMCCSAPGIDVWTQPKNVEKDEGEDEETLESESSNESDDDAHEEEEWHGIGQDNNDEESTEEVEEQEPGISAPTPALKGPSRCLSFQSFASDPSLW